MFLKFIIDNIKNIGKKKQKPDDIPKVPVEENSSGSALIMPAEYNLEHGNNKIMLGEKEILVSASIPQKKSLRLVVDSDGKISLYNNGGYACEFITDEDLNIEVVENDNPKFKLSGGNGHDKIVINDGVVIDEVYGGNGNDQIVNNGTAYYIYGGDGNDTLENNGVVNSMYGEDGDDVVINNGMVCKYIDAGLGDDKVLNNAHVGRYITTGEGNDELINNGDIAWSSTNGFNSMTGEINGYLFVDGEKYSGIYDTNGLMYQDGRLLTGISPINNKYYEKGREVEKN